MMPKSFTYIKFRLNFNKPNYGTLIRAQLWNFNLGKFSVTSKTVRAAAERQKEQGKQKTVTRKKKVLCKKIFVLKCDEMIYKKYTKYIY